MKRVFKLLVVAITVFASLSLNNVYAANENLVIATTNNLNTLFIKSPT